LRNSARKEEYLAGKAVERQQVKQWEQHQRAEKKKLGAEIRESGINGRGVWDHAL